MTPQEKNLAKLIPQSMPSEIQGFSVPSLYHCVGTDKLIGSLLGKAIVEECKLPSKLFLSHVTELSCLLRSFIVIDDFYKDNNIDLEQNPALICALKNIKDRCLIIISCFVEDALSLWQSFVDIYEMAYLKFDQQHMYQSIIQKCYLIFLPFQLPVVEQASQSRTIRSAIMDYLFCLQLLDDFQDIEEDLRAPKNHNLFVAGISNESALRVAEMRPLIVRPLLTYIKHNLERILINLESATAISMINNSLDWLHKKELMFSERTSFPVFSADLKHYFFNFDALLQNTLSTNSNDVLCMDDIRAESMHTRHSLH